MKKIFVLCLVTVSASVQSAFAAPTSWVGSYAVELTPAERLSKSATLALAYSRRANQAEADLEALRVCRSISKNPSGCKTIFTHTTGCFYFSGGTTPWGSASWAYGKTPQEAYDQCHARDLDCDIPVGGCALVDEDLPRDAIKRAPKLRYWVALAAGNSRDSVRRYVSVGAAPGRDEAHAKLRATAICNESDPSSGIRCGAVDTFNVGCGFIARADTTPNNGSLTWGYGTTKQKAYDNCVSTGSDCSTKVIGICIER